MDFNAQTLEFAREAVDRAAGEAGRHVRADCFLKSVNELLKDFPEGR